MEATSSSSLIQKLSENDEISVFEQKLNRLIEPLWRVVDEGVACEAPKKQEKVGEDHAAGSAVPSLTKIEAPEAELDADADSHVLQCQKLEKTLFTAKNSLNMLSLVQKAVSSLLEDLEHIKHQPAAVEKDPAPTVVAPEGVVREPRYRLSDCKKQLEALLHELDSPFTSMTSSRFASLVQELHEVSAALRGFPLVANTKVEIYGKIGLALEKVHGFIREGIRVSIVESMNEVRNSAVLREEFVKISAIKAPEDALGLPEERRLYLDGWSDALTHVNDVFLSKMDETAHLRRLIEFIEDDMELFCKPEAVEAPWSSLASTYNQQRGRLIATILRWVLSFDATAPLEVRQKSFLDLGSTFGADSIVLPGEGNEPLSSQEGKESNADSKTEKEQFSKPLPHFVVELAMVLEIISEQEKQVVDRLWLKDKYSLIVLSSLYTQISEKAYNLFRSRLLRLDDVTELAQTVESLEATRLHPNTKWFDFTDLWVSITQDTQERLIFRASIYLRQIVSPQTATKEYCEKLGAVYDAIQKGDQDSDGEESWSNKGIGSPDLPYMSTFPLTVNLLYALHRTVSYGVYSVLAEESILLCLTHVSQLGSLIKKYYPDYSFLCLLAELAHLHFLYQHLTAMDAGAAVVEKKFDLRQSLRHRKLKISTSSRESMQSVENQFAKCYQSLVELMTRTVSEQAQAISKSDDLARSSKANKDSIIRKYECLLATFIPDQWLRAKTLLPLYQVAESSTS